jgi:hypothetical protein
MATSFLHVSYIEKEKITSLRFPPGDVLRNSDSRKQRQGNIDRAIDAGNFAQYKVLILFEDDKEVREVETTIWGKDKTNILLKNGVRIPIERIHQIRFN